MDKAASVFLVILGLSEPSMIDGKTRHPTVTIFWRGERPSNEFVRQQCHVLRDVIPGACHVMEYQGMVIYAAGLPSHG